MQSVHPQSPHLCCTSADGLQGHRGARVLHVRWTLPWMLRGASRQQTTARGLPGP